MMLEELQRRNFSEDTIRHYIHTVEDFCGSILPPGFYFDAESKIHAEEPDFQEAESAVGHFRGRSVLIAVIPVFKAAERAFRRAPASQADDHTLRGDPHVYEQERYWLPVTKRTS
jgi:hypothetical protein